MRLLISFSALFASISMLQLSSGAIGPLDVLSGLQEGFSNTQIGLFGRRILPDFLMAAGGLNPSSFTQVALLFGTFVYPVFSVSTAHANDFATAENMVELNASLMFLYGIGAIFSPLLAAVLIEHNGPSALFIFIAVAHVFLVCFGLYRMLMRESRLHKIRYVYVLRTSFSIGKLIRRKKR